MTKREEIIKGIGDQVIDKLFDFGDNYSYDADEYGFSGASIHDCVHVEIGNASCDVDVYISWPYKVGESLEVILNGNAGKKEKTWKKLDRLNDAVEEYVEENLDTDCLLDCIKDDILDAYEDEWQQHGFRDKADYYHWRYG